MYKRLVNLFVIIVSIPLTIIAVYAMVLVGIAIPVVYVVKGEEAAEDFFFWPLNKVIHLGDYISAKLTVNDTRKKQ